MYETQAVWLDSLLELSRKPVGIRFVLDQEEFDQTDLPEPKTGLPYCTAVMKATRGQSYKLDFGHSSCIAGSRALGIAKPVEEAYSGKRHRALGVYKNLCISRSVAKDMVYCVRHCKGVEIQPLEAYAPLPPDVVVMIVNPYTAMRIVQAWAYHFGQLKNIKMVGNCAICQECTSYPHEENTFNLSMLCSGTRRFGRWGKDELAMGLPYHYVKDVIDGLKQTVTPMEQDKDKDRITKALSEKGLHNEVTIQKGQNYYKGAYGTPDRMARRNKGAGLSK
ncbi:DUF169 domain-containing protein [Desulfofustis glycolicus]|uniref:Uncharacterized conserved protein, DUF169 family n=1 Tax=Desulfofustis glycolicus DSM 9705 TaxID=1121409 RepID=A0A1M5YQY9_9BACT|nr:DUF169 domain-containing protein [Desulfofustis glycolicus]MCB2215834.1 DUF169 domain-containing protein [Desulfobulbaceae bacterium]SHI14381.1 Uncharacterized conserved protein, DUF169 family [Desulfofustis glycolicus DSM 9705]